jgi:hypothetical protein
VWPTITHAEVTPPHPALGFAHVVGTGAKPHRARRIVSMTLVVLAAAILSLAVTAIWATRTALNTDRFTATVTDVTSDKAVLDVIASRVTDEVFEAVSGSSFVDQVPPALKPVLPIIAGAVRERVQTRVSDLLSSDIGQSFLETAVRTAHAEALRILEGDGLLSSDAFSVANGTVTLDLRPMIHQVLVGLQEQGVIPKSVTIPPPGQASGELAAALGVTLPPDFGQVVVYETQDASQQGILDAAQHGLVLLKRGMVLLVVLGLLLAAAAILVATDRRRAVFRLGVAVAIAAVVLIVVMRRVSAAVPDAAATPGGRAVAAALADSLRSSLVRALLVLAVVSGIVAAVAGWWSTLVRLAATHAPAARLVAVAVGLLLLIVLGLGWGSLVFALVVVALGIGGVELASRRQAERSAVI